MCGLNSTLHTSDFGGGSTSPPPPPPPTAPSISSVSAPAGDYGAGQALTLTLNMSEAVTVSGTPTLALNDGGTATYASGSGTNTLKFNYTVASGQNTSALAVTGFTGTIADLAGNPLSTTGLPETFSGVVIGTTPAGRLTSRSLRKRGLLQRASTLRRA